MSSEEFEDPEWGSDKPMTERVDREDSVGGGEVNRVRLQTGRTRVRVPSNASRRIEFDEVKPGLWISKKTIFEIHDDLGKVDQEAKEVIDMLDEMLEEKKNAQSLWIPFFVGAVVMGLINCLMALYWGLF